MTTLARTKNFSLNPALNALVQSAKQKGVMIKVSSDSYGGLIVNVIQTSTKKPVFGCAGLNDQPAVVAYLEKTLPQHDETDHVLAQSAEFDLFA